MRYPQDFNIYTKQDTHNRKELTAFDGDPVGASVGLRGALEGEWLGLDVGCSDMKVDSKKYHVKVSFKMSINTYICTQHIIYTRETHCF